METWGKARQREKEWLAAIAPGQKCVVHHRWTGKTVLTVGRLTKTQIIAANSRGVEYRFRRDTGRTVGEGFESIAEYTPEIAAEIEKATLRNWIENDLPRQKFTLEQLRSIYAFVRQLTGEPK